jgi:hypothetical protein
MTTDRLDLLTAEFWAIEFWDRLYRRSESKSELDVESFQARQQRRKEIIQEIIVLGKACKKEKSGCDPLRAAQS